MRQNLFTIAPDVPFLKTLAMRIVDGTLVTGWARTGPFWLTDVTILLPTRRARLALAEQFLALGQALLPDIRTIGGEDGEEEPFLPPIDLPAVRPAASPVERRLVLARLVGHWAREAGEHSGFASPPSAAEIFRLADSLAVVLDDLTIERVAADALRAVAPENLAENWQQTLRFLDIVLEAWPAMLEAQGRADVAVLQNERLARQAATVFQRFGDRPVIAAGSTGSQPATADLLKAIAGLPRGIVVLPGLDTFLPEAAVRMLTAPARAPHAHPQYGLVKLLAHFKALPGAVTELAQGPRASRTLLVQRALALAEATDGWVDDRAALAPAISDALAGLAILAAPGEDLEARAIAVAARDALASGKTVGIISPDRNLARRIAAELARFDIEVDDSAGTPLFQSAAGRLGRSILVLAVEAFAPVALMALLRNRATTLGLQRAEIARLADCIELGLLRGQRPAVGLAGLRQALAANLAGHLKPAQRLSADDGSSVAGLLDRLAAALDPVCRVLGAPMIDAAAIVAALRQAVAAVAEPAPGDSPPPLSGYDEFSGWAAALEAHGGSGPSFAPVGLDAVLASLMAGTNVRATRPARSDIAIWGRLEARLQHADLMILAGLNEDVWPEPADPGPWLSRGMRLAAGLEPPERRQGQAAHDFEMAVGGPEVLLAFSARRGSSPALPSPLLQRLEAFVGSDHAGSLRRRGSTWLDLARAIDAVPATQPATRPSPNPPAVVRPRQLSVTEIETLFRSPYDLYARHVLRLRALQPLGEEPGARDRGSMIHDVFGRFVMEGHDPASPGALGRLKELAAEAFVGLEAIGERRDIWLRRFDRAAELFLAFERERQPLVARRHAEIDGLWRFPLLDGFILKGRADRIDEMADGSLEVIDFKTGGVPTPGAMKDFLAPQLPLEAAMAGVGAFEAVPAATAAALTYVKIGLGPEAFIIKPYAFRDGETVEGTADAMARRLQAQVHALLLSDVHPMTAQIFPDPLRRYRGEYDHLARLEEWAVAEEEEP